MPAVTSTCSGPCLRSSRVNSQPFAGLLDEGEAALARAGVFLQAHFEPAL
jgi:hypothetical protein